MLWNDVINSPYLRDLPFKIELNKWGKIEMSPASNVHGHQQGKIYSELKRKRGPLTIETYALDLLEGANGDGQAGRYYGQGIPYLNIEGYPGKLIAIEGTDGVGRSTERRCRRVVVTAA